MTSEAALPDTFVIERELGGGGMGRVVLARYASTGYPCAIKILLPEHRHDDELVGRFLNEAQLSNRIGHAGVRRVIDTGRTTDGLPFLVMEIYVSRDGAIKILDFGVARMSGRRSPRSPRRSARSAVGRAARRLASRRRSRRATGR